MINRRLRGLGTALITPFVRYNNLHDKVDYQGLRQLVEQQIRAGVDYLVVLGTTGESVTLTEDERRQVIDVVVSQTAGRVPLVLGLGGNCTAEVQRKLSDYQKAGVLDSFSAILSVCPYYNKPSQEGLRRHFVALAQVSSLPIILYNVPGRTGVNMLPETVCKIVTDVKDKIVGIKEASGNVEQIERLIRLLNEQFGDDRPLVISGDDGIAARLMSAGADGLISVASNAFPEDFGEIVRNWHGRAAELQERYARMVELLFKEGNPAGIKTVLSCKGGIMNVLRLPLVENSPQVRQEIADELLHLIKEE